MMEQSLTHTFNYDTRIGALIIAKRDRLDSYTTYTVSDQESDRIADGAEWWRKHAFKTRPTVGAQVHSQWLA